MRGRVKKIWNYFCFLELNGSKSSSHTQFTEEDFSLLQRNLVFHQFTCIETNKTPSSIHLRRIESQIPCQIGTIFFNRHSSLPTLFKLEMFSKIVNLVSMNGPLKPVLHSNFNPRFSSNCKPTKRNTGSQKKTLLILWCST